MGHWAVSRAFIMQVPRWITSTSLSYVRARSMISPSLGMTRPGQPPQSPMKTCLGEGKAQNPKEQEAPSRVLLVPLGSAFPVPSGHCLHAGGRLFRIYQTIAIQVVFSWIAQVIGGGLEFCPDLSLIGNAGSDGQGSHTRDVWGSH